MVATCALLRDTYGRTRGRSCKDLGNEWRGRGAGRTGPDGKASKRGCFRPRSNQSMGRIVFLSVFLRKQHVYMGRNLCLLHCFANKCHISAVLTFVEQTQIQFSMDCGRLAGSEKIFGHGSKPMVPCWDRCILVYLSRDWEVHCGYEALNPGHLGMIDQMSSGWLSNRPNRVAFDLGSSKGASYITFHTSNLNLQHILACFGSYPFSLGGRIHLKALSLEGVFNALLPVVSI